MKLAASGLLLVLAIGQTFLNFYVIEARNNLAGGPAQVGSLLSAVGIVSSLLRTLAFGLLLVAIFHGRRREQRPSDE